MGASSSRRSPATGNRRGECGLGHRISFAVVHVDHNALAIDFKNPDDRLFLQTFCARCHYLRVERFARPARRLIGADSHTTTSRGAGDVAWPTMARRCSRLCRARTRAIASLVTTVLAPTPESAPPQGGLTDAESEEFRETSDEEVRTLLADSLPGRAPCELWT
jgi:hypothetical protein